MTDTFKRDRASISFLPWQSGDGYNYGGGAVVTIGTAAIVLGSGADAEELAKELVRRWNAALEDK